MTGAEQLAWTRALIAERDGIVAKLIAMLGGTVHQGGPVCLRHLDSETGNETFYDNRSRIIGEVRIVSRGERTLLVVEGRFYLDD